jgi:hypothetical protein
MIFVAKKSGKAKKIFASPLLVLLLDPGSCMSKKSGSGINISDPQHCVLCVSSILCRLNSMRALIQTTEKKFLLHFLSLLDRKYAAQHPSNLSHSNDLLCPGRDGRYLPLARVRDALCPVEARQPGPHVQHHREPARLRHSRPASGIKK